MAKNPFKKQSIVDTVVNVGIGGAANVAFDSIMDSFEATKSIEPATLNYIKIGVGALAGSMVTNKYLRAATDGFATVGVSNLIASYIGTSSSDSVGRVCGLPQGTIAGMRRAGNRSFRRAANRRVSGVPTGVMSK